MFRIRGKTVEKGESITGVSSAESVADAAAEAEKTAKASGQTLERLTIMTLEEGAGLKIAPPRKRDDKGKNKKK